MCITSLHNINSIREQDLINYATQLKIWRFFSNMSFCLFSEQNGNQSSEHRKAT
jgi:hypothetical protein